MRIETARHTISLTIQRKPQDCWVGLYWRKDGPLLQLWACLLPTLPIAITVFPVAAHRAWLRETQAADEGDPDLGG